MLLRTRPVILALAIGLTLVSPPESRAQGPNGCTPTFTPIDSNRSLPHAYADQGLQSLPQLHPGHVMLAQRRAAQAGPVSYSLLVYRKDAGDETVTIEGVGVLDSLAWRFTATCPSRLAWDGLVTTLERVAALPRQAPATTGKK